MTETDPGLPRVPLPDRLDRPARVGPFASGRDALKFLALGGFGALIALRFGALLWLPFLAAGLLLSVRRPEGESIDEQGAAYLRWRLAGEEPARGEPPPTGRAPRRFGRWPDGGACAGFSTGGIPVAFLPSQEAERLFEAYRDALRGCDLELHLRVGRAPIRLVPMPAFPGGMGPEERAARAGYGELLELLTRRRRLRRVQLLLVAPSGRASLRQLEDHLAHFARFFRAVGIPHRALHGHELASWGAAAPGPGR